MRTYKLLSIAACIALLTVAGCSCASKAEANQDSADQSETTTKGKYFSNPVIYSDVPDVDIIRVGEDYYMVSTTAHMMPAAPIMHSKDLVNWNIISYACEGIHESSANDLEGGNIYSRGQWAACIRYHNGVFYVFFGTGNKSYLYKTTDPYGKWTLQATFDTYYHDASMLFDDDGKVYLVYGARDIRIVEFNDDLTAIKTDGLNYQMTDHEPAGLLEGSHFYKFNGKYYITMIWWPDGGIRTQVCFRSDKVDGPYTWKTILSSDMGYSNHGVAQGCFLDTASDSNWYAMLFQDHEAIGRVPVLTTMRWVDEWPILGDASGNVNVNMKKPLGNLSPETVIVSSDEFDSSAIGLNWQWNHNPDNTAWSLSERKGYLRLKTNKVVKTIFEARNTLTQRTMGPKCSGTIALDLSGMNDGDHAGLSIFCSEPGTIEVIKESGKYYIVMTDRTVEKARAELSGSTVYLKADCTFGSDIADFYYSTDNKTFTQLGTSMKMIFSMVHFTGNKFAVFYYSTKIPGGHVDVDFFHLG